MPVSRPGPVVFQTITKKCIIAPEISLGIGELRLEKNKYKWRMQTSRIILGNYVSGKCI